MPRRCQVRLFDTWREKYRWRFSEEQVSNRGWHPRRRLRKLVPTHAQSIQSAAESCAEASIAIGKHRVKGDTHVNL